MRLKQIVHFGNSKPTLYALNYIQPDMLSAMTAVRQPGGKIQAIVEVVNEIIAFQTNLLALNALCTASDLSEQTTAVLRQVGTEIQQTYGRLNGVNQAIAGFGYCWILLDAALGAGYRIFSAWAFPEKNPPQQSRLC